ncbi:MAG: hypothetical protein HY043_11040 [Verrucomicrobia bacterium]|nr:hypothetical protein [Verrucomicrobiota bacterium]
MKRYFASLGVLALCLPALAQTTPTNGPALLYENFGIIDTTQPSPQIDALSFANYGSFTVTGSPRITGYPYTQLGVPSASTVIPYLFQNTLNFTNTGSMSSASGFRFETAFPDRGSQQAASFYNSASASIFGSTYLLISSANIAVGGSLTAGSDGFIQVEGQDVTLARAGLQIQPLGLDVGNCQSFFPVTTTNFFPSAGVFDVSWDVHTNALSVATLVATNSDGTVSVSAPRPVGSLPRAKAFVRFSKTTPTNLFYQAVFVQVRDTNVTSSVRFASFPTPPQGPNPPFATPVIKMSTTSSNLVTESLEQKSIYIWDKLASEDVIGPETNLVLLANLRANTFMPSPYYVSRVAPCEYTTGLTPNYVLTNNIFYNNTYSNNVVTNVGASYVARIAATSTQLPSVPGATITNTSSRIEIDVDTLDLNRTRFKADGLVSVKARNLQPSANSVVQVADLNYDLGARGIDLQIKDLVLPQVPAYFGNLAIWSGFWTNQTGFTVTNVMPDPANPMGSITNVDTNVVDIVFHATFVDNRMVTTNSVKVHDLAMHGANTVFSDKMSVTESLTIDSERFTIAPSGRLTLTGAGVKSLTAANAPTLSYFTNLGTIIIPNRADFGTASRPLVNFVNDGSLTAATETFHVRQFENSGSIVGTAGIDLEATSAKLDSGSISAVSDMRLIGNDFKLRNYVQSSSGLLLSITNSLSDSGGDAKNSIIVSGGIRLAIKPRIGDLFGTSLRATAPRFGSVPNTWAGEDRGATVAGFSNNVVIGRLNLDVAQAGQLTFAGTGTHNGLYVDFLQFGPGLTNDLTAGLQIDPSLVIYFADSNLPAEELDGQFDGHLRWVREFAGPNSGVDVLVCTNGTAHTSTVNRSLRNSTTIDSDGDGVPNFFDPFPFNVDALCQGAANLPAAALINSVQVVSQTPMSALLSVNVAPRNVYQIEYATNLSSPVWQVFSTFTNVSATGSLKLNLPNALPAGESQRFYRVKMNP